MPKYNGEVKAQALALMAQKGTKAASEEMHISMQTLYKWRQESDQPSKANSADDAQALLAKETAEKDQRIEKLESENDQLRARIRELEEKNVKFRKVIESLLK